MVWVDMIVGKYACTATHRKGECPLYVVWVGMIAGKYTCTATNRQGMSSAKSAQLKVIGKTNTCMLLIDLTVKYCKN